MSSECATMMSPEFRRCLMGCLRCIPQASKCVPGFAVRPGDIKRAECIEGYGINSIEQFLLNAAMLSLGHGLL